MPHVVLCHAKSYLVGQSARSTMLYAEFPGCRQEPGLEFVYFGPSVDVSIYGSYDSLDHDVQRVGR